MGSCSSAQPPKSEHIEMSSVSDWSSPSDTDDTESEKESDDSLDSIHEDIRNSEDMRDSLCSNNGTTSSINNDSVVEEEDSESTNTANTSTGKSNKKVTFKEEKDILTELYSDEALLKKKRKSFGADMTLFSEMLKGTNENDHKNEF